MESLSGLESLRPNTEHIFCVYTFPSAKIRLNEKAPRLRNCVRRSCEGRSHFASEGLGCSHNFTKRIGMCCFDP